MTDDRAVSSTVPLRKFAGAGFETTVVEGAVVEGAVVEGAVVEGAVVEGAVVEGAVVEGAVVNPAALAGLSPVGFVSWAIDWLIVHVTRITKIHQTAFSPPIENEFTLLERSTLGRVMLFFAVLAFCDDDNGLSAVSQT